MATRSTIAMKTKDGKIKAIYCHWDGYVDHNGRILSNFYTDPAKVEELINLGDLSTLGSEIGQKHPFDRNYDEPELKLTEDWCMAYHRDREEEWDRVKPSEHESITDWLDQYDPGGSEYAYLFDGKDWIVHRWDNKDEHGFPIFDFVEVEVLKCAIN